MLDTLVFDMDGTIANLYAVENWEEKLRNYDADPYLQADPMYDMIKLGNLLTKFWELGVKIDVVSWRSKVENSAYRKAVDHAKRQWLNHYCFPYDNVYTTRYGKRKDKILPMRRKKGECILIDDNAEVRKAWTLGRTIDPTQDLIGKLHKLYASCLADLLIENATRM